MNSLALTLVLLAGSFGSANASTLIANADSGTAPELSEGSYITNAYVCSINVYHIAGNLVLEDFGDDCSDPGALTTYKPIAGQPGKFWEPSVDGKYGNRLTVLNPARFLLEFFSWSGDQWSLAKSAIYNESH